MSVSLNLPRLHSLFGNVDIVAQGPNPWTSGRRVSELRCERNRKESYEMRMNDFIELVPPPLTFPRRGLFIYARRLFPWTRIPFQLLHIQGIFPNAMGLFATGAATRLMLRPSQPCGPRWVETVGTVKTADYSSNETYKQQLNGLSRTIRPGE